MRLGWVMNFAGKILGLCLAISSFGQATPAVAQIEGLINGVGGAITYCVITGSCGNNRASTTRSSGGAATPRVQSNPVVMGDQSALNYFGFPAGTADGVSGRQTRAAISNYQSYLGYPATGQLTDYERSMLQTSYQRAMAGAANQYPGLVQTEGLRGLLRGFQREAQGLPVDPNAVRAPAVASVPAPAPIPNVAPAPTVSDATPAVPTFFSRPTTVSVNQFCSEINILTTANGRMVDKNSMTDNQFALDEQFCAARGYAVSRSQQLTADIQGISDTDLQRQCEGLIGTFGSRVSQLGIESPVAYVAATKDFVRGLNTPDDQLVSTGEVCLGLAYRTDNPDLVLASASMLVGAGRTPFGELIGHHLRKGFGTTANASAGQLWLEESMTALETGQAAAFLPTQSQERVALIRHAMSI